MERFHEGVPLYCDVTWHVTGEHDAAKATSSLAACKAALNYACLDTMLHLTCMGLTTKQLVEYLEQAQNIGIRNILPLRGDKLCECMNFDPSWLI